MTDHFPPFRGRVSVTLSEIADQRKKGWIGFHPEDFCHRCGGRNFSWAIDSEAWNPVMRPDGPDAPWQWNEIICPACFAELFERKWPLTAFTFALDENTIGAKAFRALPSPGI